jgi:phage shock protein PspC (stress-responsive transcriptional regulator)|tara:strand:+ start:1251 stop:1436 length:186 start_codon:yes stop_codon:yes gene_type:complete
MKKLFRKKDNAVLGGVCNGLSDYLDVDVTVIRILFLISFFVPSIPSILIYIILWIIIKEKK